MTGEHVVLPSILDICAAMNRIEVGGSHDGELSALQPLEGRPCGEESLAGTACPNGRGHPANHQLYRDGAVQPVGPARLAPGPASREAGGGPLLSGGEVMSTSHVVQRDERTLAVENASYRWGYLALSYALL